MGLERSNVEVSVDDHKQKNDAEIASALTGAVNENDLDALVDASIENSNKFHGSNDFPNSHLLKKVKRRQNINMMFTLNTELEAVINKDLKD